MYTMAQMFFFLVFYPPLSSQELLSEQAEAYDGQWEKALSEQKSRFESDFDSYCTTTMTYNAILGL